LSCEGTDSLRRVHIGLNLIYLVPGTTGGMETYARELIPELVAAAPEHRFTAFINREAAAEGGAPWHELTETVVVPVRASKRVEWVRGEQQLLPGLAGRAGIDLLHSLASTAPGWGQFRRVVTIHDLIYRLVPEAHPGLRALGMRILVPLAAWRSERIIVDAASTREDLRRLLGIAPERVDVVPLGVRPPRDILVPEAELRGRLGLGQRPMVLSVSAKLAHKNLRRLIEATARLGPEERPVLVLPGYPTPHEQELRDRAAELGVTGDVVFLGWVSASELEGLYAAASGFVFPSLAEGFGLPVLEAMARGVPVACSGAGALGEVAGDAALRFDPHSVDSIADSLRRLVTDRDLTERLAAAGRKRARGFTWSATATGTLAAYRRAAGASV
jgi:glycosyltransferase involved in cell wall biosynthesis